MNTLSRRPPALRNYSFHQFKNANAKNMNLKETCDSMTKQDIIDLAKKYLNDQGTWELKNVKELLGCLKKKEIFNYAAELMIKLYDGDIPHEQKQTFAKLIYKDHSLPSALRYNKAIEILKDLEKVEEKTEEKDKKINVCETFGLRGAIYKRRWEFDGQFKNLTLALKCYEHGLKLWRSFLLATPAQGEQYNFRSVYCDFGYTAINAAFVCELTAMEQLEQAKDVLTIDDIKDNLVKAAGIRKEIITAIADRDNPSELGPNLKAFLLGNKGQDGVEDIYFVYATLFEAHFGLCDFKNAQETFDKMIALKDVNKWKTRSAAKQLMAISDLQEKICAELDKPGINGNDLLLYKGANTNSEFKSRIIATLLYGKEEARAITMTGTGGIKQKKGKYGIGLSGGGHRAALYHIGVLANLAENDMLKHLEVISCVSGGSIAGAFYYLCLKKVLESKADKNIVKQDYINIIKYMQEHFKSGVQKNLRSRMFSNLWDNFKMMSPAHTRTHKMGRLYEEFFYQAALQYDPANPGKAPEAKNNSKDPIIMDTLIIKPFDDPDNFDIHYDNWKRRNKIPQLVLNATCLNTGHNFQFTAKWMGVPPGNMQPDIDVKPRLRRMYYSEAPGEYRNFRLGYAVAASSCVPLIFRALPMSGLYPGMKMQLIDGGYHENQGMAALLEQECKNLIVSDGSGQLSSMDTETPSDLGVFYRSDVVVQERVRELEFMDTKNRQFASQVESISIVHLRKGLTKFPRNWVNCQDPPRKLLYDKVMTGENEPTDYGIDKKMQQQISEVRTDLDSFNDTECYMLMYDGYGQMKKALEDQYCKGTKLEHPESKSNWHFLAMSEDGNKLKAERLMPFSNENAFKFFRYLWRPNKKRNKIILQSVLGLCMAIIIFLYREEIWNYIKEMSLLKKVMILFAAVVIFRLKSALHYFLSILKFMIFKIHICTIDKFFLKAGSINVNNSAGQKE